MGPSAPHPGHERIHESPDLTVVDLEDCEPREVTAAYRALAARLTEADLRGVLVRSGRRSPEGHRALSDALRTLMRHARVPSGLRLALLPQTPRVEAVFTELAREFKGSGIALRVFADEAEALAWLALEA